MVKQDLGDKLEHREQRRKQGVVSSMLRAPVMPGPNKSEEALAPGTPIWTSLVKRPSKETRSRRKQILLQPTTHDRAEAKCKQLNISMNEVINQLLDIWTKEIDKQD